MERDEQRDVRDWREMQLLDLGFAPQEAEVLAQLLRPFESWHDVKRLLDLGLSKDAVIGEWT